MSYQPESLRTTPFSTTTGHQPASFNQGEYIQQHVKSSPLMTILKILYVIGFLSIFIMAAIFVSKKYISNLFKPVSEETLLETKYQMVLWKDFGEVFEPIIKIPIYYPNKGYVDNEFLLDSGAVVSSLPREMSEQLGFSLSRLQRSTFAGFGGTTSFAYKANLKIQIGGTEITLPVVFTEAVGTKSILGRSGFFENYSIYFNSKTEKIEIRK